jgi:hypothetical protein|tara:strand:+ start:530 stop:1027 length:498 start_codon:yes stop_codon:yes gene_type:complete
MTKQTSDYHGSKMMKTNETTSLAVAAVALLIQALSLPAIAEETHGEVDNSFNLSLRMDDLKNYPIGGTFNTAIGLSALGTQNSGGSNIAVGFSALGQNTTGTSNTAVGRIALSQNTTGSNNTAVGSSSLYYNTTGQSNTATGSYALHNNTTGENNVAYGNDSSTV